MVPVKMAADVDCTTPIIDYAELFSDDKTKQSKALNFFSLVCEDYGFFCLVNHGVAEDVFSRVLQAISEFFDPTNKEDRRQYEIKNPTDRIRWGTISTYEENREHLKVAVHPEFNCPPQPLDLSEALEEYSKALRKVELSLAKAISKSLGFEEDYIEKALDLEYGFDVFVTNAYPPNFKSQGSTGLADHTDPGFIVTLVQDINGGLQVKTPHGKWCDISMPPNAIFVMFSDHLEIVTNGKYKSSVHKVMVKDNKARRLSATTLHGPSLGTVVKPASEFVDESHPRAFAEMAYQQCLQANGFDAIDVKSSLKQLRLI